MNRFAFLLLLPLAFLATDIRADERPADDVVTPDFEKLAVTIEPFGLDAFTQVEELRIETSGRCWYKVKEQPARLNLPAKPGAVFDHPLSADVTRRLNKLLLETDWLTAAGADGRATHTHPTTMKITLTRDGKEQSVVCQGQRPEPYASLLHAIQGLATQERRIYLHRYVRGDAAKDAWEETGREIAALRGDSYGKPVFEIDYRRYLPIAIQTIHPFHVREDHELITAVRLIGHFKVKPQLAVLHQMAHDRNSNLRREVAWAIGQIQDESSLPVLASMMSAPANGEAAGLELLLWGEPAVPHIVTLIQMSADAEGEPWERTSGEDMIRAYLDHWDKVEQPIDPRVVDAARVALAGVDPQNGLIRTSYHKEFLERVEKAPAKTKP